VKLFGWLTSIARHCRSIEPEAVPSSELNPPVTFHVPTAGALAMAGAVRIFTGSNFWITWAEIAVEEARAARVGRASLQAQVDAGADADLRPEMKASLKSIGAVSFSLDAVALLLEATTPSSVSPTRTDVGTYLPAGADRNRGDWVAGWLTTVFPSESLFAQVGPELHDLFELRNGGVHHRIVMKEPSDHPLGLKTTEEAATYTTELADRYTRLLGSIFAVLMDADSPDEAVRGRFIGFRPAFQRWLFDHADYAP